MRFLAFTKMVASGNDFVVIDARHASCVMRYALLAKKMCDRKFGIGADGLLVLEKSKRADVRMRIFNADGSEAEMCGNGSRCVAFWLTRSRRTTKNSRLTIETKAGIIDAEVDRDTVKIKLTDPKDMKLDIPLKVGGRTVRVNFINTGVPHAVIFSEGLDALDVSRIAPQIRYHAFFAPRGTNVNFTEVLSSDSIKNRTYERGVEDETLACGTGSVASALIFSLKADCEERIKVHTRSGEKVSVYYRRRTTHFSDVWLEGKARIVFKGEVKV